MVVSARELRGPGLPTAAEEQTAEEGVPEITDIGDLAAEPQLQSESAAAPADLGIEAADAADVYKELMAAGGQVFDAAAKEYTPDPEALMGTVKRAFDSLRESDDLLTETVRRRSKKPSWAQRAASVSILGMRLGLEVEYDERRGLALGLCALMHDIGMLTIPEGVLASRSLTPQQLRLLRNHPVESQRMAEEFGSSFSWIGKVVVQVHERHDGGGYPQGLSGEEIHEFARIIGLADSYVAMSHPRADREAQVTYNALSAIVDLRNKDFHPRLIKALIQIVSIFPLGSLVRLNNNEVGRVIRTNRLHSARPLIEIMLDSHGGRVNPSRVTNLENEPMLYIVDPAIEESVLEG